MSGYSVFYANISKANVTYDENKKIWHFENIGVYSDCNGNDYAIFADMCGYTNNSGNGKKLTVYNKDSDKCYVQNNDGDKYYFDLPLDVLENLENMTMSCIVDKNMKENKRKREELSVPF